MLCEVLQAAHSESIIHRDLKPANLMIVDPGTPYELLKADAKYPTPFFWTNTRDDRVHPAHAHISRPERYATDSSYFPNIQEQGRKTFLGHLKQIDERLAGRQWLSDAYSTLDPYAFTFYTWGVRRELPMAELKNYTAHKDRMLARPAVRRVVDDEKVKV